MRPKRGSSSCDKQATVKQQKHTTLLQKAPPLNGPLHVSCSVNSSILQTEGGKQEKRIPGSSGDKAQIVSVQLPLCGHP